MGESKNTDADAELYREHVIDREDVIASLLAKGPAREVMCSVPPEIAVYAMQPVPDVEFRHPEFGVLTCDSGIWSGDAQLDGCRTIRFSVGGTDQRARSLSAQPKVGELLERVSELSRRAVDFLRARPACA
ncbi:MAG: hypothetical protein U0992_20280 [Planctomycetaceae bacterium]